MKNHCKLAIFSSILLPNGLFLMDIRWHCSSISICCLLHPKKWVFGSKSGKFWNFQNFRSGSFLRLWRPCHASPRARRCLWAERNSRRWFWVLNGLCATSGSRDMGRQSFLAENQKFQKIHFYHLSPSECVYIHQNGTQRHQLVSYENTYHCGSFWGYLTGKRLVLSLKLLKNTTEKGQNQANPDRPFSGPIYHTNCHWWLSVHPICTQKWWLWAIGWVFWQKIVFFGHCWPFCLKKTPELPQNA